MDNLDIFTLVNLCYKSDGINVQFWGRGLWNGVGKGFE